MCNEYQHRVKRGEYWDQFAQIKIPLKWTDAEPNRPADQAIRPTERAAMIRALDPRDPMAGLEGVERRWWLAPHFHRGPLGAWKALCTNARLETLDTTPAFREAYRRRRCLVPLTSFIEYDTPPGWRKGTPKRRWEVSWTPRDALDRVRYFAGVWDSCRPSDHEGPVESFAIVTGPAGQAFSAPMADTGQPLHHRQARVLTLAQGVAWLRLDGPGKALLEDPETEGGFVILPRPRALETPGAPGP